MITQTRINQSGAALITIVIMMPFLIAMATFYTELTVNSIQLARRDQLQTHAQLAADGGVDQAVRQINQNSSWTGTGGEVLIQDTNNVRTTYAVTVSDTSDQQKTIVSTGRSFQGSSTTPTATINVEVRLRAVQSGEFSVVTGVGGLIMRNSSKIVNGSVYINGNLTMSNTAQIGLLSVLPVDVKVAHQSCPSPADATYPRVCASGENGQPITLNNSARIYGRVEATNQTNGAGMSNTGLVLGSIVPPVDLPDYDREGQKAAVTTTINAADADCGIVPFNTWPANLRIIGDVTISGACIITVQGNVWITGSLNMRNSAIIRTAGGLTQPPVIMVDGQDGLRMNNSSAFLPNLGSVGTRIITYASSAACSPDCTDVTGADLLSSQSEITIDIDNIASGAQTEFYARWSKVTAGNAGSVGALVGQTVELRNGLAITLGTSVTGFGEQIWLIDRYRRIF